MGRALRAREPGFCAALARIDAVFRDLEGWSVEEAFDAGCTGNRRTNSSRCSFMEP